MIRIILSFILFCSFCYSQNNIHSYFESQILTEFDSTKSINKYIGSFIRFNTKIKGKNNLFKNTYSISGGGIFLENFNVSKNNFSPEWDMKSFFTPLTNLNFRLFSRNIQYSPTQYITYPESKSESIHGVEIQYEIKNNSTIVFQNGIRNLINEKNKTTYNYSNIELQQRSKLASVILIGNINSNDSIKYYNQKLILNSKLNNGWQNFIYLANNNELFQYKNISTTGIIPLYSNHFIQWDFNKGISSINQNSVISQEYIFKYEYKLSPIFSIENKMKNEWYNINEIDISHWRQYQTGIIWNSHNSFFKTLGGISFGFREDAIFGNGPATYIDILCNYTQLHHNFISLQLTNILNTSTLSPIENKKIEKMYYEIDNKIDINSEIYPANILTPGVNLYVNSHLGSDLTYSPDTLQNIINSSIYTRFRYKSTFLKLSVTNQFDLNLKSEKIIYSCDYSLHPINLISFTGFFRYQNNNGREIINFRSTSKIFLGKNSINFDIYHSGLINNIGKINTQILIRFIRRF